MYDVKDSRGVPVSTGIPPVVRVAVAIGIVMILTIVGAVVYGSTYHHVWPSINSTHIKLD
jgi:hypothetical protein